VAKNPKPLRKLGHAHPRKWRKAFEYAMFHARKYGLEIEVADSFFRSKSTRKERPSNCAHWALYDWDI